MTQQVMDPRLVRALGAYKGRWVAVDRDEVVAAGASAAAVVDEARKRGVTDPLVFRVPAHPERLSFL